MVSNLLIYTPSITPRIKYAFALFFESLINTPYKLTTDIAEYSAYNGPRLNYSQKKALAADEIFIMASGLLTDSGIKPQSINVTEWEGLKIFFQTGGGTLPFDVFAASFYLISRYEEYTTPSADEHKRFKPTDSLALKNHFIDVPLVNLWADKLKKIISEKYPRAEIKDNTYTFTPTIDIDVAYAHKGRTLQVTLGAYAKALVKFDFALMADKTMTLLGLKHDAYDTYNYQEEVFKKYNLRPICFFLAGKRGVFDKNISTKGRRFSALVKKVSTYADVGIHPSYHSAGKAELVGAEIKHVEKNLSSGITKSRQHFLRITLPDTYRCLAALGITDDYSMAYAACPGFRASICTPFYFYDLQKEEMLPVKLHPTVVMDGTLNEYMSVKPGEAILIIEKLIERVKQTKGEFVSIWHNDTLNDKGKWKGWQKVFEAMIEAGAK